MNKQIINAAIKQSGHYADILNGVLYVSKFFQTNANYYGTTEYHKMNEILAVYQLQILIRRRSAYPAYPRQF